jgi:hypothetical protein
MYFFITVFLSFLNLTINKYTSYIIVLQCWHTAARKHPTERENGPSYIKGLKNNWSGRERFNGGTESSVVQPCLLVNRLADSYRTFFTEFNEMLWNFSPKKMIVDFEVAIHNAAQITWPSAQITGCRFHVAQNWCVTFIKY